MKRLFLLVCEVSLLALNVRSADRGLCGDNIGWLFRDGVLTVSGEGEMYEFGVSTNRPTYEEHKDEIKKVIFSGNIEAIGPYAFDGYAALDEIQFNEGLKTIYESAFRGCVSLKSLNFPASLEALTTFYSDRFRTRSTDYLNNGGREYHSFFRWYEPREINLKMKNAEGAFASCSSLESVTFGESLKRIGQATFAGCVSLKTLYWNATNCGVPRGYRQTGEVSYESDLPTYVFTGCPIETVVFGENVRRIPRKAFENVTGLADVRTNGKIEYVGGEAFEGTAWANSQPGNEMWYIDKVAYQYVPATEVTGVKQVVRIRDNVASISHLAFNKYNVMQARGWTDPISELIIPETVGTVADQLLSGFKGDSESCVVRWNAANPVFSEEKLYDGKKGEVEPYKYVYFCDNSRITDFIFGEGVTVIEPKMLYDAKYIKRITLPSTLRVIGESAFDNSGAAAAAIPPQVESIGDYAFRGVRMDNVIIPNSTEYLGKWALPTSCKRLEIGENVKSDTPIRAIDFPELTELVWNAVDITPEDGFKSLYPYPTPDERSGALNVSFGDKVKVIPACTFIEADFPISISGGTSVTTISDKAFYKAKGLSGIYLPETLTTIGESAFTESNLADVLIPASVKTMSADAFENCPMDYAISAAAVPPVESAKVGFYMNAAIAPKLYVPDVDAYSSWQPAPLPMLKSMEYYIGDGLTGEMQLTSNIPGYTAATTHKFATLVPGDYTETIPVHFKGEKEFSTDVKYSYTIKEGVSSIENVMADEPYVRIEHGELVITGNVASVKVVDLSGRTLYDGNAQRIPLASGIYLVLIDGTTHKIVI